MKGLLDTSKLDRPPKDKADLVLFVLDDAVKYLKHKVRNTYHTDEISENIIDFLLIKKNKPL